MFDTLTTPGRTTGPVYRIFYFVVGTLFTGLAILGLFTITGFPGPLRPQIVSAFVAALAVQVYLEVLRTRQRKGMR